MQLPVLAVGHDLLRQRCAPVQPDFPDLARLIDDLWETMHKAEGCGLSASQVGRCLRLFVVDSRATYRRLRPSERQYYFDKGDTGLRETFLNVSLVARSEHVRADEEGCLSLPGLSREITRPWSVTVRYTDRDFNEHVRVFTGYTARIIQHEYDHTEGILYTDYLPLRQQHDLLREFEHTLRAGRRPRYPMQ